MVRGAARQAECAMDPRADGISGRSESRPGPTSRGEQDEGSLKPTINQSPANSEPIFSGGIMLQKLLTDPRREPQTIMNFGRCLAFALTASAAIALLLLQSGLA